MSATTVFMYAWGMLRDRAVRMAAAPKKAENITISARLRRLDPVLLLAALALIGIGILAVYVADTDYQRYYAVNQAIGLVAGLVLATPLALVN